MANQRHPFNNAPNNHGYLPNGQPHQGPVPGAIPLLPNQGRVIQTGPTRLLCIADVRGNLRSLNELAKNARADYIIHTGDFGFYDEDSLERIAEKTLKHVAQYSPLIADHVKKALVGSTHGPVKSRFPPQELPLSELSLLLKGELKLDVPVYTVWGACEDVRVLERFRSKEYKVNNLFIVDEAQSMLLEVAGVKLRLLGLGGAVVMHKLFDNGEGRTTIAGGQGTMWTTLLQMGELVDTANRVYDPTETRLFITHASPAREGILNQLSVALKADFSISAGLHFRYGSSYNEFSVNPTLDHYRGKLASSKASFNDVWDTVKNEVEPAISQNEAQQLLLKNALAVVDKMPSTAAGGNPFGAPANGQAAGQVDESAFKNMWNFNLADAAFGYLVLEIHDGRIGTEMRAQGFNFSHRGAKQPAPGPQTGAVLGPQSASVLTPSAANAVPVSTNSAQPPVPQTNLPASAPTAPAAAAIKPSTPAPSASPAPRDQDRAANDSRAVPESTLSPAPKSDGVLGLFVTNVTDEEARAQFDAYANQSKITTILTRGRENKHRVVCFATEADRDDALEWLNNSKHDRTPRLRFSVYQTQGRSDRQFSSARGGAGNWASSRGGGGGLGRGESGNNSTGYTASDSERDGNRRGGRGGGRGRGGDRGGRGPRGRGGGFKGSDGASNGSPAPSAAAPAES